MDQRQLHVLMHDLCKNLYDSDSWLKLARKCERLDRLPAFMENKSWEAALNNLSEGKQYTDEYAELLFRWNLDRNNIAAGLIQTLAKHPHEQSLVTLLNRVLEVEHNKEEPGKWWKLNGRLGETHTHFYDTETGLPLSYKSPIEGMTYNLIPAMNGLKPFLMSKYLFTVEDYLTLTKFKPRYGYSVLARSRQSRSKQRPLTAMQQKDAVIIANGHSNAIPTLQQWLNAAYADLEDLYPWGTDAPTRHHASFDHTGNLADELREENGYDWCGHIYDEEGVMHVVNACNHLRGCNPYLLKSPEFISKFATQKEFPKVGQSRKGVSPFGVMDMIGLVHEYVRKELGNNNHLGFIRCGSWASRILPTQRELKAENSHLVEINDDKFSRGTDGDHNWSSIPHHGFRTTKPLIPLIQIPIDYWQAVKKRCPELYNEVFGKD